MNAKLFEIVFERLAESQLSGEESNLVLAACQGDEALQSWLSEGLAPNLEGRVARVETGPGAYRQVTRVSFESPVLVQTLVLRVPPEVQQISADATGPVGTALRGHGFGYDGHEKLVEIQLEQVVTITEPLQIRITQTG